MVWCADKDHRRELVKKSSPIKPNSLSTRIHFPEDEPRLPWLSRLLDAYAISDTGVAIAIRDAGKKQNKILACSRGCDVCCCQPDIPVYPHEMIGLSWYAAEKLDPDIRAAIQQQLADHTKGSPCPFLVNHACSVHPLRPLSCRQFNVFTTPCAPGEDPYYTRQDDVLVPIEEYKDRAFSSVVSFYEISDKDVARAVQMIKKQIVNLQENDWKELVGILKTKKA